MTTGGNSPGTLAEATKTSRKRALAPAPPFIAIDPKSHITGSPVLTSVVATSSSRPVDGLARDRLDQGIGGVSVDQFLERRAAIDAGAKKRAQPTGMQQVFGAAGSVDLDELIVPVGTQESIRSDQGAGADAGDH